MIVRRAMTCVRLLRGGNTELLSTRIVYLARLLLIRLGLRRVLEAIAPLRVIEKHSGGDLASKRSTAYLRPDGAQAFTVDHKHAIGVNQRKPRIGMCSFAFSSGGGEILPIWLANELYRAGHDVLFIDFNLAPENPGIRGMLSAEIPVIHLTKPYEIRRAVKQFDVEILHSHHASVDMLIRDWCGELNIRHVITLHGMYEAIGEDSLKVQLPQLLKSVREWVYVADKNLVPILKIDSGGAARFTKITNAVPRQISVPVTRNQLSVPENAFVVCLASRPIAEKGWAEAIDITKRARDLSGREIHLLLLGDHSEAEELGLTAYDFVHLLGFKRDVQSYLAAADIGILPTYYPGESFPLVILEGLMAGKPFLATDIGDIRAMLSAGNEMAGEVFKLREGRPDREAFAGALARLASDRQALDSLMAAVPKVSQRHDVGRMRESYERVYQRALAEI